MEALMNFSELADALGGRLLTGEGKQTNLSSGHAPDQFSSVSIDSREISPGGLFVALRGSSLDGHRYVHSAIEAGAYGAIVESKAMENTSMDLASLCRNKNIFLIIVEDSLKALQKAAAIYLERFPDLVKIGITGSSGKTSTKEIAAAIIGREKSVIMSKGNYNSETGLPLSVFQVRAHHEVGIFEAAMNQRGEMRALAEILTPHLALITNIGTAHIGNLGTTDAIAAEKKEIFAFFNNNNTAFIPDEDNYRDFLAEGVRGNIIFFGMNTFKEKESIKEMGLSGTNFILDGKNCSFKLPGKYNFANAIAAISLAKELSVSSESIIKGLESVKPLFGRGEIIKGKRTLIRDCYNSNPESANAALDFCDSLSWPGRKLYVLGSMLELGEKSETAHADLGSRLASSSADMIFLYGEEMKAALKRINENQNEINRVCHTTEKDELSESINKNIKDDDLVLLKGSRGCALESLTDMILGEAYVL